MYTFKRDVIRTLREFKHISRRECAAAIQRTEVAYGLKENGTSPFTADEVAALASLFRVKPSLFFGGSPGLERKRQLKLKS